MRPARSFEASPRHATGYVLPDGSASQHRKYEVHFQIVVSNPALRGGFSQLKRWHQRCPFTYGLWPQLKATRFAGGRLLARSPRRKQLGSSARLEVLSSVSPGLTGRQDSRQTRQEARRSLLGARHEAADDAVTVDQGYHFLKKACGSPPGFFRICHTPWTRETVWSFASLSSRSIT